MSCTLRRVGAGLTVALALSTLPLAAPALATTATHAARPHVTTRPIVAGAGWLATQFTDRTNLPHPDGDHFGSTFGGTYYPDYGENADAIFGMAAAGVGSRKIATALRYLRQNVDAYADLSKQQGGPYDGSIAKLALAVLVAHGRPRHFGGYNLLRTLRNDECPAASTTSTASTTCTPGEPANIFSSVSESFVVLAEARAGTGPSTDGLAYFESLQCANGGFTSGTDACGTGDADVDATSYAIMALQAAGGQTAEIARAVAWLRSQQQPAGYWESDADPNKPNVNSTGLAVGALAGVGRPVKSARNWLRSQQVPAGKRGAGAFEYEGSVVPTTTGATSPSVLATAQALTGLGTNGSLAVVSVPASGNPLAPVFRPAVRTSKLAPRGKHLKIRGFGFAAGERARVTLLNGTQVGRGAVGPLGVVRTTWLVRRSLTPGRHTVVIHGLASGLAARQHVLVPRAAPGARFTSATFADRAAAPKHVSPTHVGIDIQGKGVRCVAWHKGITGDEILNDVATVKYRSDGLIVQIDGKPASGKADGAHFWSYWHDSGTSWKYSSTGASGFQPKAGEVEGWAYDNGAASPPKPTAKPSGLYAAICGGKDKSAVPAPAYSAAPTRSATPTPSSSPRHTATTSTSPVDSSARPSTSAPARPSETTSAVAHRARAKRAGRGHRRTTPTRQTSGASRLRIPLVGAGASSSPLHLLTKPTAADTSTGSPVGTYVVIGLVVLLLGGGAFAAVRRRSSS